MEPDRGVGQLLKKEKTELETFCLKSSWTTDPSDPIIKLKNYLRISHITFFYFYKKNYFLSYCSFTLSIHSYFSSPANYLSDSLTLRNSIHSLYEGKIKAYFMNQTI